ncbi:MAG TPA: hypothetical protein VGQ81_10385 [Acidobacteriota bacterium]|nr:hypothetical protein [Acidobacteriota bacterium]
MRTTRHNYLISCVVFFLAVAFAIADNGPQHQAVQTRPIQLGTSGGNINDISRLFCCSGTLGSLVQAGTTQYILSNNHVLAKSNQGAAGDPIIQPGLADLSCVQNVSLAVANLTMFVPISFKRNTTNTVDAAIAQVIFGDVDPTGSILDIGPVNSATLDPTVGLAVKKSGRTTGLTAGNIQSVNVTVDVTYNKQCGIGSQTARFVNQFTIGPGGFSAGGDSGSLIVENVPTLPRPVGLLFAGSSSITVANPINAVLSALGVGFVGSAASLSTPVPGGTVKPADIVRASDIKSRHEEALFAVEGVRGTGIGVSGNEVTIEVYVVKATPDHRRTIPSSLEGVPVQIVETGEIVAY